MAFIVRLCLFLIIAFSICHYVHGTYYTLDMCNVEIAELRQLIQQILDRQKSYEIKLSNQQKIIDKQEIEISTLKDIILQRFIDVNDPNIDDKNIKHEGNESLIWKEEEKVDAKNHSTKERKGVLHDNERKPRSQSKKDSTIRRSVVRKMSDNFYNTMTPKGLEKRQVGAIAFSVYLSHDADLNDHGTVKFDKIITNEGNGYNTHTGAFTCPEGGLYLLSFFIGERDIKGIWLNLKVNSINVIDAAVDTYHPSQDLQGGNTVILRLKTGDIVLIESFGVGGHAEGSPSIRLTSFSGVLLSP